MATRWVCRTQRHSIRCVGPHLVKERGAQSLALTLRGDEEVGEHVDVAHANGGGIPDHFVADRCDDECPPCQEMQDVAGVRARTLARLVGFQGNTRNS